MSEAVQIGPAETLRLERTEVGGKQLVAVRVFTGRPGDPAARPTKKGLTLRLATWKEILPALERLLGEGEENGETDTD